MLNGKDGQPTVEELVEVTLKECRRQNVIYKMQALQCAAAILHSYNIDRMKDIADILSPVLPQVGVSAVDLFSTVGYMCPPLLCVGPGAIPPYRFISPLPTFYSIF